jgi:hypothetical protein
MDTLPRNFILGGRLVTFVLRDTRKLLLLIVAVVCFLKENAACCFFPRRMSPKWSGTQSVDTQEIVYSFLLEIIQRPQFSQSIRELFN